MVMILKQLLSVPMTRDISHPADRGHVWDRQLLPGQQLLVILAERSTDRPPLGTCVSPEMIELTGGSLSHAAGLRMFFEFSDIFLAGISGVWGKKEAREKQGHRVRVFWPGPSQGLSLMHSKAVSFHALAFLLRPRFHRTNEDWDFVESLAGMLPLWCWVFLPMWCPSAPSDVNCGYQSKVYSVLPLVMNAAGVFFLPLGSTLEQNSRSGKYPAPCQTMRKFDA